MEVYSRQNIWRRFRCAKSIGTKLVTVVLVLFFIFSDVQSIFHITFLPNIETAHADNGDFSIFRNNADTSALTTTPLDVTWDTTVSESANLPLQVDNASVDLAQGGKYLVMYNVWASDNAGSDRRSIATYLTLDGTRTPYGGGAGYIRDSGGDLDSYNSGAAIIDATAGQDLAVVAVRDDTEASAVAIRSGKNGLSVLKMKDDFDYLRLYKTSDTSGVDANTTFTDVVWDASDEVDTGSFAFTNGSSTITLKGADGDHFLVTTNVKLKQTANSSNRLNFELVLTLDGAEIPGSKVTTYLRGNPNSDGIYNGTLAYSGIIKKTSASDQTLNIEVRKESIGTTATTDIIGSETALSIAALPDTGKYISLTDETGGQTLSTTRSAFSWDKQLEVNTSAFSHSTTTNNSRINFDADGDYLFFSTAYSSRTSGTARSTPVIEWQLDGTTLQTYGGHGAFNRGDQGTNDAFTAGSSGGLILNGITSTQYLEVTKVDESASTNPTFPIEGIAVQGVKLSELFIADIDISATGTHTVDADIVSSNVYSGGGFVIESNNGTRNVTSITINESGTVDGGQGLENIKLYYDLDTTGADGYDCSSESYGGGESQFGSTDTNGFSGSDGVSSFSGSVSISPTQSMCVYTVYDVNATSSDGQTVLISIDNPSVDVSVSGSPSINTSQAVAPAASTTLRNAELTQTNYNWRNDDGTETTATSIDGTENTPAIGFANGTTRRLRLGVSAEGSTSTPATQYRLEYGQKVSTCSAVSTWTDVGTGGGGDWDIVNTANLTDGNDTTNVALQANGGITDPVGGIFLTPNGGQKDTSSQTGNIILTSGDFTELEFALEPTVTAPQGNTYCFRVSDAGTALRNYTNYPEGTISADIDVSASSSQVASLNVGATGQYVGGTFVIERPGSSRTLTDITVTETGTVDAQANLANPTLFYDLDTTAPYDCTGESYSGLETSVAGSAFSGPNGSSTFTGLGITVRNTQAFCGYIVFDIGTGASNGETANIEISDPSTDVVVAASTVGPSTVVSPTGSTTISGPIRTQTGFHWRNDNGSEVGATSDTAGVENTAVTDIPKLSPIRLRMQVSNAGTVSTAATQYRLEYGTKVTTCTNVGTWTDVGAALGAFDMTNTANLTDGSDTTDVVVSSGGVTNPVGQTFLTPNGGQKDTSSQTGNITLTSTEFTEIEYAIEATADAGDENDYCFRITDAGTPLESYTNYPELTTRVKQDFYIQRGVNDVTGTGITLVAGTDYTAPASTSLAFIRITNSQITGAGDTSAGGTQSADDVTAYISNPGNIGTSVDITRPATAASSTRVYWEIIEYTGIASADNEMKVRDVGTVTYGGTALNATGTSVTGVVDDADVVVFITGQLNPNASTGNYNDGLSTAAWNATSSVPVFTRGDADSVAAQLSYAVVEFTGANWKIQRVEHAYTADGVTETENISAVSSLGTTFIHAQKRVGNGLSGLDEFGAQVWLSSIGAVSFKLRSGANTPADHVSVAWVIENTQTGTGAMNVYRSSGTIASGGAEPESNIVGIGGTINMANASIWVTNDSSGAGTAYPRTILGATILSTTQYELWNSDTGQNQDYRTEIVEWPVAEISMRQNYYRFYVDNDLLDPTDPWPLGASDLGENTSITGADDPLGEGDRVRIRMSILINNAVLPQAVQSYKLQFGKQDTTCSAISVWTDLGDPGTGSIWRGYNGTVTNGNELATSTPATGTLNISVSDVAGTYQEQNNSSVNPYSADLGEDIEYDWSIEHNGATQLSDYCFRMVESDGTELDGYNNYPTLRTTGYTPVVGTWRWYDDADTQTPVIPLAGENITPTNLDNENKIKLRVIAKEVEGAPGVNVKFALQFSEHADFSDGGTYVVATSSCTANSLWCYVDGAGVTDNEVINTTLLSDADSCVAGVGDGCGMHNEIATSTSVLSQASLSTAEHEFTIKSAGARVGAVYYFRLYDVPNDVSVSASSSYPSIVAGNSSLTFSVTGLPASTVTEGVTLDAASASTSIGFGSLLFNTEEEAAQRLTVDTNATEGYQILMFTDQEPTNSYGGTIQSISGTNAAPSGWSSGCTAGQTGCVGYHAGDDLLIGGSARFGADDSYAGLSTTPQEIMYSSVPTNESHDIVYKIQVGEEQAAGTYENNITYIAVPVF